jgi:O-antigen ligase
LLIGAACCLLLFLSVRGWWKRLLVLAGSAAIVALAVPLLSGTLLGTRFEQFLDTTGGSVTETGRMVTWRAAGDMFRDFPLTGSGFGSFRDVFPRYMPAGEAERWAQLHNDYFEVLVEGGIVAAVLLLWLTWGFWRRIVRRAGLTYDGRWNPEALGLLLGILTLTVHAGFDFNHQIPANALLFVTLAAIAAGRGDAPNGVAESPQ